uniref:Uncharacterized protein n=1 Tax=Physcomitrium patens TaxID=3218 RepID=A0A7I4A3W4_PHYPA
MPDLAASLRLNMELDMSPSTSTQPVTAAIWSWEPQLLHLWRLQTMDRLERMVSIRALYVEMQTSKHFKD